jgi:hypothetical protein
VNIRASMTSGYNDCRRRSAARQWRRKFEKLGYEFRQTRPSVGSATGTSCHTGIRSLYTDKWNGREMDLDGAVEQAIVEFRAEIDGGAEWDDTTQNANVAETQIRNQINAYLNGPCQSEMPLTVKDPDGNPAPALELKLEAKAAEGWLITGHIDLVTVAHAVRDYKTGSVDRSYHEQLGTYSLLVRSNNILTGTTELYKDYVKRCRKTKLQEPPVCTLYPVKESESAAMGTIKGIMADMAKFDETQNLDEAFPANLFSQMCSPKYCCCYATDLCPLTKLR